MLRQAFAERLKEAMKARDARTISTVRLIIAGLKDRDIAAARTAIAETGATGIKDTGKVMTMLRERHAGVIDLGQAGAVVRAALGMSHLEYPLHPRPRRR